MQDVIEALAFVAGRPGLTGVFNASYGGQITVLKLARRIVALTGSSSTIDFTSVRAGDVRDSRASIDRLRSVVRNRPAFSNVALRKRSPHGARSHGDNFGA